MLLLVVQPAQIRALVRVLAQDELSEDPHEALAQWLARLADRIDVDSLTFGAVQLLAHGVVKLILVIAILRIRLWAYPRMIAVLLAFIGYQVYRVIRMPTAGTAALTILNVVVTVLTMIEYGRHHRRDNS